MGGGGSSNQILGAKGDVWLRVFFFFAPPLSVDPLSVHPVKGLSAAGVEPQSGGERRSSGCISRVFVSEYVRACGWTGRGVVQLAPGDREAEEMKFMQLLLPPPVQVCHPEKSPSPLFYISQKTQWRLDGPLTASWRLH